MIRTLILCLALTGCATPTEKPLCKDIVLAQYAAFKRAGYKVELVHMENDNPKAAGFKYHIAVRIQEAAKWYWVKQPKTMYTTTTLQPAGTKVIRTMTFKEVAGWVK